MPHDHRMRPLPDSYMNAIRDLTDQIANPKKKMGAPVIREDKISDIPFPENPHVMPTNVPKHSSQEYGKKEEND